MRVDDCWVVFNSDLDKIEDRLLGRVYVVKIGGLYLTPSGYEGNQKRAIRFDKESAKLHTAHNIARVVKLVKKRDYCGAV